MTIVCRATDCHGIVAARSVDAVVEWETKHTTECPTPEPEALADLRAKLRDLEECDDPDYEDWCDRIDRDFMPLIITAAHLLVLDS